MNKLIKELAEQAHMHSHYAVKNTNLFVLDVFKEKFAELIVQECMALTSCCSGKVHPDDLNELFKEHFGFSNKIFLDGMY